MKLLHIEDDPHFAQLLHSEFLSCRTVLWEVVHADCLREARARIEAEDFDAVLADLSLPGSDELTTCQELCHMVPNTPLVVLAHGDGLEIATQAVQLGAQDCLFKGSLNGPMVIRRVRFAIERHEAKREKNRLSGSELSWTGAQPSTTESVAGGRSHGGQLAPDGQSTSPSADRDDDANTRTPLRVLHVEDDTTYAEWMRQQLEAGAPGGYAIEHCTSLHPALTQLGQGNFAAVILDLSLPDSQGVDTLNAVLARAPGIPVMVVTGHNDESLAVQSIRKGAEDYLVKTDLETSASLRSLRLALTRTGPLHDTEAAHRAPGRQSGTSLVGSQLENGSRLHARYLLNKPIFVVPVRYNNMPDEPESGEAMLVDLSSGGLAFQLPKSTPITKRRWVVGIEADDGQHYYAAVEIRNAHPIPAGLRVGAKFASSEHNLLSEDNLAPTFDPETGRIATALPRRVLDKWAELGVVRPVLLDRIFVCPVCRALPTFSNGCRACGSTELTTQQQVRHFACGYVGPFSEFQSGDKVRCPKCQSHDLMKDADFEFLDGTHHCHRCGEPNAKLVLMGSCLHCRTRFPMDDAVEEKLIGYETNRLDPQSHLDSI